MSEQMQDASQSKGHSSLSLPAKIVVSLRVGAILAIANIVCAGILAWAWVHAKAEPLTISVTGSAKKVIQSDMVVWRARIVANDPDLGKGYDTLKAGMDKALAYLKKEGVAENEITVSSISTRRNFAKDAKGKDTDKIRTYDLTQTLEVSSSQVLQRAAVARKSTELIKEGVMLESDTPTYIYTKLGDMKITMLAEATKDATVRAQQIAANSGAKLGALREARMGVMQINARHVDDITGSGVNDTSSYEKEITAVISAKFALQ